MRRRAAAIVVSLSMLAFAGVATPLHAQTPPQREDTLSRHASFMSGASFGDGETALALSAGLGWTLSPRIGFEFELAYARKLDFTFDVCPSPRVCVRGGQLPVIGRTVSLVPHLVLDLRPHARVRPYVQAGVGMGHVRQRYWDPPLASASAGVTPLEYTRSKLALAVSAGGGIAVSISRRFAIGADIRSLTILDDEPSLDRYITPAGALQTVRVGSRVTWRF